MGKARVIKELVVHCSASDDSLDIGLREIKHLHTAPITEEINWSGYKTTGRGWTDVGYHYIIRRDGTLERGRQDWQRGAHVKNRNRNSIGICWVGRNQISNEQYHTLMALLKGLMNMYDVDIEHVLGHGEIDHLKTCPNLNMLKLRANLLFFRPEDIKEQIKEIMKII